jgi:hypothetical protein
MRPWVACSLLAVAAAAAAADAPPQPPPPNPAIDIAAYLRVATEAAAHRESHRLTEDDFIRISRQPGVIVLDARSKARFDELHVAGALNLAFPDISIGSLRRMIPDRRTTVLIYCNNNFSGAEGPFASKLPSASLNISTYIALYNYGYRNVYELGPQVDLRASRLTFAGTSAR